MPTKLLERFGWVLLDVLLSLKAQGTAAAGKHFAHLYNVFYGPIQPRARTSLPHAACEIAIAKVPWGILQQLGDIGVEANMGRHWASTLVEGAPGAVDGKYTAKWHGGRQRGGKTGQGRMGRREFRPGRRAMTEAATGSYPILGLAALHRVTWICASNWAGPDPSRAMEVVNVLLPWEDLRLIIVFYTALSALIFRGKGELQVSYINKQIKRMCYCHAVECAGRSLGPALLCHGCGESWCFLLCGIAKRRQRASITEADLVLTTFNITKCVWAGHLAEV